MGKSRKKKKKKVLNKGLTSERNVTFEREKRHLREREMFFCISAIYRNHNLTLSTANIHLGAS